MGSTDAIDSPWKGELPFQEMGVKVVDDLLLRAADIILAQMVVEECGGYPTHLDNGEWIPLQ